MSRMRRSEPILCSGPLLSCLRAVLQPGSGDIFDVKVEEYVAIYGLIAVSVYIVNSNFWGVSGAETIHL